MLFVNSVYADADEEKMRNIYNPQGDGVELNEAASYILGVVQVVGYASAVVMLSYIGMKYLLSSPEGKADLKKQFTPYFIGAVILFAGSSIAGIIGKFTYENIRDSVNNSLVIEYADIEEIKKI